MRLLIKKNLKYPKEALEANIEGTVLVRYTINYKGKVIEAQIIKGIGHGCDKEAIRLVKLFKFNTAKTRKIKIQYHKNIQIHFKIPAPRKTAIRYTITKSGKSNEKKTSNNSGYHYTINID